MLEILVIYIGGGNSTNSGITYVIVNGGTITGDVFGGSNLLGTVQTSNVTINDGNINNVYGGNNQGGTTLTPNVIIEGGETTNVYRTVVIKQMFLQLM